FLLGVFDALRGSDDAEQPRIRDLGGINLHASRWLFELAMLPHAAYLAAGAIWLTMRRVLVDHRGLLNWRTAADAERDLSSASTQASWWREMAAAPVTAVVIAVLVAS